MGTRAGRIVLLAIAAFFALTAGKAMAAPSIESEPQAMNFGDRVVDAEYSDRYVDVFGIEIDPVQITGLS